MTSQTQTLTCTNLFFALLLHTKMLLSRFITSFQASHMLFTSQWHHSSESPAIYSTRSENICGSKLCYHISHFLHLEIRLENKKKYCLVNTSILLASLILASPQLQGRRESFWFWIHLELQTRSRKDSVTVYSYLDLKKKNVSFFSLFCMFLNKYLFKYRLYMSLRHHTF